MILFTFSTVDFAEYIHLSPIFSLHVLDQENLIRSFIFVPKAAITYSMLPVEASLLPTEMSDRA